MVVPPPRLEDIHNTSDHLGKIDGGKLYTHELRCVYCGAKYTIAVKCVPSVMSEDRLNKVANTAHK